MVKYCKKAIISLCLCGSMLVMTPQSAFASYTRYINTGALNVRDSASNDADVIGSLEYGTKVTCYGSSTGFTKIKYNGKYGYVGTSFLVSSNPSKSNSSTSSSSKPADTTKTYKRYVTSNNLNIRSKASSSGKVVGSYKKGTKITCYGVKSSWTKVKYNGSYAYVATNYLSEDKIVENTNDSSNDSTKVTGQDVVNYAKKFNGNPYVWGGTSLTKGADCSGFTLAVYKKFGYSLPHSALEQRKSGFAVGIANRKPGDLICYQKNSSGNYHVGIYIGNDQVIQAQNSKVGIRIVRWDFQSVYAVRRLIK